MNKFVGDPIEWKVKHMYCGTLQDYLEWESLGFPEDFLVPCGPDGRPELSKRKRNKQDDPKWNDLGNSLVIHVSREFDSAMPLGGIFRYDGQLCKVIEKADRWSSGIRIQRLGKRITRERPLIE